jgi:HK97 family phage prohead protease
MGNKREYKERSRSAVTLTKQAFGFREFKALDDNAGTFSGYVAVFGNRDGNGDVIDRGAFKKTLNDAREYKEQHSSQYLFPILWQHDEHNPIGGFTQAFEDDKGLFVQGELDLDTADGQRAYSGMKKGYLRGLSIGYDPIKSYWGQDRARHLAETRLWEGSPVTFPANDRALVGQVKAGDGPSTAPENPSGDPDPNEAAAAVSTPAEPGPVEAKQLGGLQELTMCAVSLDNLSDTAEGMVETLAGACGMAVEGDGDNIAKPDAPVAALLASVDGLEDAVRGVITAWQEFDQQTDTLLAALGIPDNDIGYADVAPAYMAQLQTMLETKEARQLSATNRDRLQKVAYGLQGHVDEIKSMLKENDSGKIDENAQDVDIDQIIAAGRKPGQDSKAFDWYYARAARKPALTTSSPTTTTEPDAESTQVDELAALALLQEMELRQRQLRK